jgi:hypothetical protein
MPYETPKASFVAGPLFVERVGELQVISEKFQKREVVLTDNAEKYTMHLAVQFQRKECGKADLVRVGDLVEVRGELRGREYNGRFYTDVIAHEIRRIDAEQDSFPGMSAPTGRTSARPPVRQPDHIQPSAAASDLTDQLPF